MKRNNQITAENIVRHYMKKLGYKVVSVTFDDPIEYEDGYGNYEMSVTTSKEFVWNAKSYNVFRRCEEKLIKKFNMNLDII